MKKSTKYLIMPIFLALILPPEVSAQKDPVPVETTKYHTIGIKFGRIFSDLWFIGEDYSDESPVKTLTSFNWGVSLDRILSENLLVNIEMMYIIKGRGNNLDHVNIRQFHKTPFDPILTRNIILSQSILFNTKGKVSLYAGPEIYQAISVVIETRWEGALAPRSFDLGAGLKAGLRVSLQPSIVAKIEINGTSSIIPIYSKSEIKAIGIEKYEGTIALNKTMGGTVSLCYRF